MAKSNETVVTVRDLLVAFAGGASVLSAEQAALTEKRAGTYSNMVAAGILSGSAATFERECDTFMADIRLNVNGIARKLKCAVAKKQPKDQPKSKPVFTIPSGFSAAKSYILGAYKHGVLLADGNEPRAYGAIRKDVDACNAAAEVSALKDDALKAHKIREQWELISERLDKMGTDDLVFVAESLAEIISETNAPVIAPAAAVAATPGESLAA